MIAQTAAAPSLSCHGTLDGRCEGTPKRSCAPVVLVYNTARSSLVAIHSPMTTTGAAGV